MKIADVQLLEADRDVAASIAELLREEVSGLSLESPVRDLALQSAQCWSSIAGHAAKRHLAVVTLTEFVGET